MKSQLKLYPLLIVTRFSKTQKIVFYKNFSTSGERGQGRKSDRDLRYICIYNKETYKNHNFLTSQCKIKLPYRGKCNLILQRLFWCFPLSSSSGQDQLSLQTPVLLLSFGQFLVAVGQLSLEPSYDALAVLVQDLQRQKAVISSTSQTKQSVTT